MYSDDHNFIIRYMPSQVHDEAHVYWRGALLIALVQLTPPAHPVPLGCRFVGATTFQVGLRKKQADSAVRSVLSHLPSVVLEVGDSESLTHLKIDAKLWLEHMPEVQLVILLSIDPPIAAHPNLPRIIIQL